MKICLSCSAGGHLTEMLQLLEAFKGHTTFFMTFREENSKHLKNAYFVKDPKRNPLKILLNILQTLYILAKERPDIIVTTGAGGSIAACFFGKMLGARIIYIEGFARVNTKSLTGRIIYPIADLFLVQWKPLLKLYGRKARYRGSVF
jgi:UDP-N-acetylglucosamine:LPS N-acetylglucosamine transferase